MNENQVQSQPLNEEERDVSDFQRNSFTYFNLEGFRIEWLKMSGQKLPILLKEEL